MIKIEKMLRDEPYIKFKQFYEKALRLKQSNIEAVCISSFNNNLQEVNSRFVNLKYIVGDEWTFFSNYNSPKGFAFNSHNQIAALFYWSSTNVQIRMKAQIKKASKEFNQKYFYDRPQEKNALAISSNQSKQIDSYNQVKENYDSSLKNDDLKKCPEYWGGYSFIPYYFEFWEGHELRLNKREVFDKTNGIWMNTFLQP